MKPFSHHPTITGFLLAVPVAAVAAAYATAFLGPDVGYGIDLGDARGAAFAAAALVAAGIVAARVAREDLGTFSGLVAFVALAQGLALVMSFGGAAIGGAFADGGVPLAFLLAVVVSVGATLPLWVPAGLIWVAALRRLTIPGLRGSTEEELAASEAARDARARDHVRFDATQIGNQLSRLRRNRT